MKRIIVTGTSRGIGLSIARELLDRKQYDVIGTSTTGSSEITHAQFACYPLQLDQEYGSSHRESSILDFIAVITGNNIRFDGLINNAAVLLEDWNDSVIDMEQLRQTFEVNVFGTVALTEQLLPLMNPGAHIINIGSGWGSFSEIGFDAGAPHYKMSKAALHMYTKVLAVRLQPRDIRVSAFDPGWVKSDMGTARARKAPETAAREIVDLLESQVESGNFWDGHGRRTW